MRQTDRLHAAMPDIHQTIDDRRKHQRDIAAFRELGHVGEKEACIDDEETGGDSAGRRKTPTPDFAHGDKEQKSRHQHGRRDGDAIGRRQIVGFLEGEREADRHRHQNPIHRADVNLADAFF